MSSARRFPARTAKDEKKGSAEALLFFYMELVNEDELSVNSSARRLTIKSQNDILLWNSYSLIFSERRQTMLKLRSIVKDYQAGDATVHALRGVSLNFRESEFVAILGHSGCGKTTLLNIIGGLEMATRCIWPPDIWLGFLYICSPRPTFLSASIARALRSAGATPESVSASSTFCSTL